MIGAAFVRASSKQPVEVNVTMPSQEAVDPAEGDGARLARKFC